MSIARIFVIAVGLLGLAGCQDDLSFDIASQIGPDPKLPPPRQYLFPPMKIAQPVGWSSGQVPTVAKGLKVQALATGLEHPRTVYVLPNGDVLVAEPSGPPPNRLPAQRTSS